MNRYTFPASVAQLAEQLTLNQRVLGSSPSGGIETGSIRTSGMEPFRDHAGPFISLMDGPVTLIDPHRTPGDSFLPGDGKRLEIRFKALSDMMSLKVGIHPGSIAIG